MNYILIIARKNANKAQGNINAKFVNNADLLIHYIRAISNDMLDGNTILVEAQKHGYAYADTSNLSIKLMTEKYFKNSN